MTIITANGEYRANGIVATNGHSKTSSISPSPLVELAQTIVRETEKLDKYLKENGRSPIPSFDINATLDFPSLPEEIQKARQKVIECTRELGDLVVGPTEGIRWMAWDVSLSSIFQASGLICFVFKDSIR